MEVGYQQLAEATSIAEVGRMHPRVDCRISSCPHVVHACVSTVVQGFAALGVRAAIVLVNNKLKPDSALGVSVGFASVGSHNVHGSRWR